ncbi:30S ribosomal protein S17 [Halorussus litoreus]|uniref:30S ribosomal protein S17 n=1 Tax=Halorussus litoreus TaxID=1710536 RepID=UPI000E252F5D|nr:30S ribosomal protein S17 [Halorussus litoreus]
MAIGLNVPEPEGTCSDENCPFHGTLSVRGQTLEGEVASTDMDKTVIVEREYDVPVPKYDRYMKRRSRVPAHAPECMELSVGDTVRIAETRPLSKTKSHVVVEEFETTRSFAAGGTEHGDSTEEEESVSDLDAGGDD